MVSTRKSGKALMTADCNSSLLGLRLLSCLDSGTFSVLVPSWLIERLIPLSRESGNSNAIRRGLNMYLGSLRIRGGGLVSLSLRR